MHPNEESSKPVLTRVDGDIATLVLNRPEALNSLDLATALALGEALDSVAAMQGVRALILQGAGRSFCGGGDVSAMHAERSDMAGFLARVIDAFHDSIMKLAHLPMPVIASVHGAVAGGGISLALACDIVLVARSTRFVVAYPQLGAPADGGLSFQLTRRLGPARALEILTIHGSLDASRALALGLVNEVVDADDAHEEARRWATAFAALPRQSVLELKQLVSVQSRDALQEQLAREKAAFMRCAETEDFKSRVATFAERASRPRKAS